MAIAADSARAIAGADGDLIWGHFADFNARRLEEAARRFHPDAPLEHVTGCVAYGPDGYRLFATQWLDAFPDAALTVEAIQRRSTGLYDVDLVATGTHRGTLVLGSWVLRPTNFAIRLPARQLLQVQDGLFRFATLSFDLQNLVRQLATVDVAKLLQHVARIQQLGEQLAAAQQDPPRQRELIDRLGAQIDGARHVVRPFYR